MTVNYKLAQPENTSTSRAHKSVEIIARKGQSAMPFSPIWDAKYRVRCDVTHSPTVVLPKASQDLSTYVFLCTEHRTGHRSTAKAHLVKSLCIITRWHGQLERLTWTLCCTLTLWGRYQFPNWTSITYAQFFLTSFSFGKGAFRSLRASIVNRNLPMVSTQSVGAAVLVYEGASVIN